MFTFGVNIVKGIHILCALKIYVQNLDHKRVKYPFGIGSLVGVLCLRWGIHSPPSLAFKHVFARLFPFELV